MTKIFLLVLGFLAVFTFSACTTGGGVTSDEFAICGAALNPFDEVCAGPDFDDERLENCFSGANAETSRCADIVFNNPCIGNPFAATCDDDDSFADYLDNARFQRFSHCSFGGGEGTALCSSYAACTDTNPFAADCNHSFFQSERNERIVACTDTPSNSNCNLPVAGSTQTIRACITTNPFDADCDFDEFNEARRIRVDGCDSGDITGANCTQDANDRNDNDTQTITYCINNPFHADCIDDIAFNGIRAARMIACGGASNPSGGVSCTEARSGATAANLLRSFSASPLDETPNTTTVQNQFLQGTEVYPYNDPEDLEADDLVGLNFGTVRITKGDEEELPVVTSLNLGTAFFENAPVSEEGDIADGVAFFFGQGAAYAGILAGTDLGPALTSAPASAEWQGRFRAEGLVVITSFTLDVNYGAGSAAGTVEAFVQFRQGQGQHYLLNGNFDTNGVISGTVNFADFTRNNTDDTYDRTAPISGTDNQGMLIGLIGEEGAVGAFIRDPANTTGTNYAGGFVAAPPPEPSTDEE